jgi:site-specific DNA-methyltransferase (adenine-specific)
MSKIKLIQGDCLEEMKDIPDGSIDMVLADPPYGTTACKWDAVIPLEPMWEQLNRVIKKNGAIVMTASQPFTTTLIASNINGFAFCWVWDKCFAANFVQAKRQPLKDHEDIVVFTKTGKQPQYFPQMIKRDKPIKKGGNKQSKAIPIAQTDTAKRFSEQEKTYDLKYPTSQIRFNCREGRGFHPTQKPVSLMEYLIKTYTNEEETVLDFTMGSGSTGVACKNLNRNFIGIELNEEYFEVAKKRISVKEADDGLQKNSESV